jgi:NADH-quinone oxidoreductase subunit G
MADNAPPSDLVTLTIDGHEVKVPKGTLVVEAAKTVGIEIPVFCYHPKLKPYGACRMCLVEIEKMPRLQTACTSPVGEGMAVTTKSPNVIAAQNGVIELLLANHPLDCPICDKGGECPLQNNAFGFGVGTSRFTEEKRKKDKAFELSDRIILDRERCIMCYRCTRFQAEIPGDEALAAVDRAGYSEIGTLDGESFDSPFSGNTIELCPVGALTSRQYRFQARPWDLQHTTSVCSGCAVGCNLDLHARDGRLVRMWGHDNPRVNDGWLCDAGRFDTLPGYDNRATQPMVRQGGQLQSTSWESALARAAEMLRGESVGVVASPSLTNEAIWLVADALRAAKPAASVEFSPAVEGAWPVVGSVAGISSSKTIILVDIDPWVELPVLALALRKPLARGATIIAIGPENGLYRDTAHWLRVSSDQVVATLEDLLAARTAGTPGDGAISGRRALQGAVPTPGAIAAAASAIGEESTTLLFGERIAADGRGRAALQKLAELSGANGTDGLVGAPVRAANGRGALTIAADVVRAGTAAASPSVVLQIGNGTASSGAARRIVVASSGEFDDGVDVVLPMTHLYEQDGSLTNLEGLAQHVRAGGHAVGSARPDWQIAADLVRALGGSAPATLADIQSAIAQAYPSIQLPVVRASRRVRMLLA